MIIRPYTPADRQGCLAAFISNMPGFFAEKELPDFEHWLDHQEDILPSDQQAEQYYVVEQDDKVIACGGYFIDIQKSEAKMTWGLVSNHLHKKGIGKKLLVYRIEMIKSISEDCNIALDTTQHAYLFFQKLGFVVSKITKDYYAPGLHRYDMELR